MTKYECTFVGTGPVHVVVEVEADSIEAALAEVSTWSKRDLEGQSFQALDVAGVGDIYEIAMVDLCGLGEGDAPLPKEVEDQLPVPLPGDPYPPFDLLLAYVEDAAKGSGAAAKKARALLDGEGWRKERRNVD